MRSRKYLGGIVGGCFLFLTLTSLSFGAGDFPALKDAKDPAEKARVQKLHEGALAEGKLNIVGTMIEPKMAQYIVQGFKEYYGLPGLKNEYTYEGTARIVTRVDQVVNAGRPGPDIVWNVAWAWYMDLMGRNQIMKYESPMYKEYTISNKVGNSMPGYWVSDSYTDLLQLSCGRFL
jgi:hypothetical protein